jgi:hypothetical protein
LFAPENIPNIGLFFAGVAGILIAIRTLRAIQRQADIMEGQLTIAYRAYLGIIEPQQPINERGVGAPRTYVKFPIVNNGHVPAQIVSVEAEVIIQQRGGKELYRKSMKKKISRDEIPPENSSSYAVAIYWPSDITNAEATLISIAIEYKTGFKETGYDKLSFVRVFLETPRAWAPGYGGIDIDLTKNDKDKNPT